MEKLQLLGSFGLEVDESFAAITYPNRDGYAYSVIIGDERGTKSWLLKMDTLPADSADCNYTTAEGEVQSAFDYYLRFIKHHCSPVTPFYITCPEDGLSYSVVFVEPSFTRSALNYRFWSGGGVRIVQYRAPNGLENEGVSIANPMSI